MIGGSVIVVIVFLLLLVAIISRTCFPHLHIKDPLNKDEDPPK
jgi:hypothetical protein